MGLKIFGTDPENQPKPRNQFADDIVGRFRSGHQMNGIPASLSEWRVTTGDPEVAAKVYDLLGGDAPQEWEAKGEDNLEVFTASKEVGILIEGTKALRQRMVLRNRNGQIVLESDGETMADGTPDPDAELTLAERKLKAQNGLGPSPQIDLYFRLADEPDLGIFKFQSGSWTFAVDLAANDTEGELADLVADGNGTVKAKLKLELVEYTAKRGPRAGSLVSYTKPSLKLVSAVTEDAEAAA
jgi:hypothetical protein